MSSMKKPMPVGMEDFWEIIEKNCYFGDKPRLIKENSDDLLKRDIGMDGNELLE